MRNKHISVFLATVLLFLSAFVYGNVPDGTKKDGTNKPGATTGNDSIDGAGQPQTCLICKQPIGSSGGNSGGSNGGKGKPDCISMDFHFGHLVHSDVIPAGTIKLLSDAPSPKIFSPQGLYFDFNLESYATHKDNKFTVTRPNGFKVVYDANGQPTDRKSVV